MGRKRGVAPPTPEKAGLGPAGWKAEARKRRSSHAARILAERRRKEAARKREDLARRLRERVARDFPGCEIVPAVAGGRWFRRLADETGYSESALAEAAKKLKLWPWSPGQVVQAFREWKDGNEQTFV